MTPELLILDTSKYDDPSTAVWHASPRYTASFLRRQCIEVAVEFIPVFSAVIEPTTSASLALYFEVSDDIVTPSLDFLPEWRRSLPATTFLVGGATAGQMADGLLSRHSEINGIVVGECEETLADVVFRLRAGQPISGIPGLRSRDSQFLMRAPITNLDDLGMMVRDGFDELFRKAPPIERVAYVLAGRGCYADCTFCSVPDFIRLTGSGKRWRGRSVSLVVDEMESIANGYGVHRFVFQDDNFFGPGRVGQARAREFAAEILRRHLQIEYFVTCRINDVDAATLAILKESGLTRLGIGVESLNQSSLSLFHKGFRVESIYPALQVISDMGIACEVNLIFFEPLMNLDDVHRNLEFLDYIATHEWLSYSDAFPFRALQVAPWSRIAVELAGQGALEDDGVTCRFRDRHVAALAEFANRLQASMPLVFKQRSLVFSKLGLRAVEDSGEAERDIALLTTRLREWLGLTVLPRYMRAGCAIVSQRPDDFASGLVELERSFDDEMAALRRLGRRLETTVANRTGIHEIVLPRYGQDDSARLEERRTVQSVRSPDRIGAVAGGVCSSRRYVDRQRYLHGRHH
jgi:radical SAM family protein